MTQNAQDPVPSPGELQDRLMKAYLSGDGAAVVAVMELIEAAGSDRVEPRRAA